jgi:hypothetical protein
MSSGTGTVHQVAWLQHEPSAQERKLGAGLALQSWGKTACR